MKCEWDASKAASNLQKHGVSFEEAATALADSFSLTGADPDHSVRERRFVTFGMSSAGRLLVDSHTERGDALRSSAPVVPPSTSVGSMKKVKVVSEDSLRTEYKSEDFAVLVRGKYASRLKAASNVVVLRPEVATAFPNGEAVNDALMGLINLAKSAARPTRRTSGRVKARR